MHPYYITIIAVSTPPHTLFSRCYPKPMDKKHFQPIPEPLLAPAWQMRHVINQRNWQAARAAAAEFDIHSLVPTDLILIPKLAANLGVTRQRIHNNITRLGVKRYHFTACRVCVSLSDYLKAFQCDSKVPFRGLSDTSRAQKPRAPKPPKAG